MKWNSFLGLFFFATIPCLADETVSVDSRQFFPIKEQFEGTCYAYASTAAIEAALYRNSAKKTKISEEFGFLLSTYSYNKKELWREFIEPRFDGKPRTLRKFEAIEGGDVESFVRAWLESDSLILDFPIKRNSLEEKIRQLNGLLLNYPERFREQVNKAYLRDMFASSKENLVDFVPEKFKYYDIIRLFDGEKRYDVEKINARFGSVFLDEYRKNLKRFPSREVTPGFRRLFGKIQMCTGLLTSLKGVTEEVQVDEQLQTKNFYDCVNKYKGANQKVRDALEVYKIDIKSDFMQRQLELTPASLPICEKQSAFIASKITDFLKANIPVLAGIDYLGVENEIEKGKWKLNSVDEKHAIVVTSREKHNNGFEYFVFRNSATGTLGRMKVAESCKFRTLHVVVNSAEHLPQ